MRKGKTFIGWIMCLVMVLGCLAGCGGVSTKTGQKDGKQANSVLLHALQKVNSAESLDMDVNMSGAMKVALYTDEFSTINMSADVKVSMFENPTKMKYTTSVKDREDSETYTTIGYITKQNDEYVNYENHASSLEKARAGDWQKSCYKDEEQLGEQLGLLFYPIDMDEDIEKYTKKEDIEEKGKKYQVYEYGMPFGEVLGMDDLFGDAEKTEMGEAFIDDMKALANKTVLLTLLVDPEKEELYQLRCQLGEFISELYEITSKSVMDADDEDDKDDSIADDADKDENDEDENEDNSGSEDAQAMKCDIAYTVTYSNLNSVSEFEIPEEALKAPDKNDFDDYDEDEDDCGDEDFL